MTYPNGVVAQYTYGHNNPVKYIDPSGHVVTQADIDRAYKYNSPAEAAKIVAGIAAATDAWNNAKTTAEKDAAHAEADRLRGITTNTNGSTPGVAGGDTYVYLGTDVNSEKSTSSPYIDRAALQTVVSKSSSSSGSSAGGGAGRSGRSSDSNTVQSLQILTEDQKVLIATIAAEATYTSQKNW